MGAFFRDTLSVHSPLPLDLLVRVLRDKLVPPDSSGNWFLGPLTHPFRGDVTPEGFALWTRHAKLTPRVRGRFAALPNGTDVRWRSPRFAWPI